MDSSWDHSSALRPLDLPKVEQPLLGVVLLIAIRTAVVLPALIAQPVAGHSLVKQHFPRRVLEQHYAHRVVGGWVVVMHHSINSVHPRLQVDCVGRVAAAGRPKCVDLHLPRWESLLELQPSHHGHRPAQTVSSHEDGSSRPFGYQQQDFLLEVLLDCLEVEPEVLPHLAVLALAVPHRRPLRLDEPDVEADTALEGHHYLVAVGLEAHVAGDVGGPEDVGDVGEGGIPRRLARPVFEAGSRAEGETGVLGVGAGGLETVGTGGGEGLHGRDKPQRQDGLQFTVHLIMGNGHIGLASQSVSDQSEIGHA